MDAPPTVSESDLAATPPAVLALLRYLMARVEKLEAELAVFKSGKVTPANSSKPPSSTHPHDKPPPKAPDKDKPKRKRGGQPGHAKHERPLRPTSAPMSSRSSPVNAASAARRLSALIANRSAIRSGNFPKSSRSSPNTSGIAWSVRAGAAPAANCPQGCRPARPGRDSSPSPPS